MVLLERDIECAALQRLQTGFVLNVYRGGSLLDLAVGLFLLFLSFSFLIDFATFGEICSVMISVYLIHLV